jgi:hypothetical protein
MDGPVSLHVDPVELGRVHADLQALVLDQSYCDALLEPDATSMGGADVAEAVRDFTRRWDAGRNRLVDDLGGAAVFVETAIQSYDATESGLADSPWGTPGGLVLPKGTAP